MHTLELRRQMSLKLRFSTLEYRRRNSANLAGLRKSQNTNPEINPKHCSWNEEPLAHVVEQDGLQPAATPLVRSCTGRFWSGLKNAPGRANPPPSPIGIPSPRQHAAPVIVPSASN